MENNPAPNHRQNTTQNIADAANNQQKTRYSALSPHISIIQQLKAKSPFPAGHGDKKILFFLQKKYQNSKKKLYFCI